MAIFHANLLKGVCTKYQIIRMDLMATFFVYASPTIFINNVIPSGTLYILQVLQ